MGGTLQGRVIILQMDRSKECRVISETKSQRRRLGRVNMKRVGTRMLKMFRISKIEFLELNGNKMEITHKHFPQKALLIYD